ncbi:MAG: AAA family ATPase [Cellulomonas sp.]|uniref:helix-turn-helix transcriptional regulator n=1 Tax=Cellulomonas sp. TaxID=40001 RepID=UPI001A016A20|nr:LuxR family transcriptional regulator [Cellulomonas sp.]MBF0689059.1 AAA family ATPase [Cellulomonas sp.]
MERLWPLTGRGTELRDVAAAARPGAAGILVAGPAGVGKTRLARESLAELARRGTRVVWAVGSEATRPVPFGAFAGLVDVPPADAAPAVARMIDRLARPGPFVLAVDDAHLLDDLSAVVLHRVVLRGIAPAVVTVREPAAAPDVVTSLWKDELLPRLDLDPLDLPTTTSLVSQALQGPVESGSAQRLWTLTGGSPLLLRHVLAAEVASGRLSPVTGLWLWSGDVQVSSGLATLVDREIGRLEPPVRDVLDLVALGEPLAWDTLLSLAPHTAVDEAERPGLVRSDPSGGGTARLGHPVYGEVRRARMGTARARHLRGRLVSRLATDADPITRAVLLMDSDVPLDRDLLLQAAGSAVAFHDLPLAERLARAAAADGGWDARLVHAATLSWLTQGEAADAVLRDLVTDAPGGPERARARVYRAGNLLFTLRRADDAARVASQALGDPDAGAVRMLVEAMSAVIDVAHGRVAQTLARCSELVGRELPDDLTRLLVVSALAAAAAVRGDLDSLATAAAAGGAAKPLHGIPAFGFADWLVTGYRLAGLPSAAQDVVRGLVASSADLPGPARPMGLVLAGHASLAAGRPRDALGPLREAWAMLDRSEHEFRFRCRTLLATAQALAGRPEAALPLLAEPQRHPAYTLHEPDDLLARAWAAGAEGAVTEAVRHAETAAATARRQDSPAFEVLAWQAATQLGGSPLAEQRLAELVVGTPLPRATAALRHARAHAAQAPDALVAAAHDWEQLGDLVAAGDAAAQASDLHRRSGRRGSALSAATYAQTVARRSGARTPALLTAVHPLPLTAREREAAALVARGLSNREIAERLVVSVRTVEGHLYRAGRKLGVADRAAMAAVVGDHGFE